MQASASRPPLARQARFTMNRAADIVPAAATEPSLSLMTDFPPAARSSPRATPPASRRWIVVLALSILLHLLVLGWGSDSLRIPAPHAAPQPLLEAALLVPPAPVTLADTAGGGTRSAALPDRASATQAANPGAGYYGNHAAGRGRTRNCSGPRLQRAGRTIASAGNIDIGQRHAGTAGARPGRNLRRAALPGRPAAVGHAEIRCRSLAPGAARVRPRQHRLGHRRRQLPHPRRCRHPVLLGA